MSRFALQSDLSDFITPAQECVKPVLEGVDLLAEDAGEVLVSSRVTRDRSSGSGPAKISLHDCLACSGCITTAETVLISVQSKEELQSVIEAQEKIVVVSVSAQSRDSLAARLGLPPSEAMHAIRNFLSAQGVNHVVDTVAAQGVALCETYSELSELYSACGSLVPGDPSFNKVFPLLVSSCPGWVCYAEKKHAKLTFPHLSKIRSPQGIVGAVLKRAMAKALGVRASDIYHASVEPCFDRKLEAVRDELVIDVPGDGMEVQRIRETDCVLSTFELLDFLEDGAGFPDTTPRGVSKEVSLVFGELASGNSEPTNGLLDVSGGYADYVYRRVTAEAGLKAGYVIDYRRVRNVDFLEAQVQLPSGQSLRVAKVFGFRNIQNIIRRMRNGRCPYHLVEVMACPRGCTNGGGQIRAVPPASPMDVLDAVNSFAHKIAQPEDDPKVQKLYDALGVHSGSMAAVLCLEFRDSAIPEKLQNPLAIKW